MSDWMQARFPHRPASHRSRLIGLRGYHAIVVQNPDDSLTARGDVSAPLAQLRRENQMVSRFLCHQSIGSPSKASANVDGSGTGDDA
jgi:hypothetical protein